MSACERSTWATRRTLLQAALLAMPCAGAVNAFGADDARVRSFDLTIVEGRVADGARSIRVHLGDTVELRWRADRASVIHLHGYDLEIRTEPGNVAVMRFEARATGRFPIETHAPSGRHVNLLYLEVHPR